MSEAIKILRIIVIFFMIAAITGCAPAKKNTYFQKKNKTSHVDASKLGRNKYYFSPRYQKKLNTTFKKK